LGGKRTRGNGEGDVYPRKNKEGKTIGYRGAYWVQTAKGPRRRYVSGKNKSETRAALTKAKADRDGGLVFEGGTLTLEQYLSLWLSDSVRDTVRPTTYARYEQNSRLHITPTLGRVKLKTLTTTHVRTLYREKLDAGLSGRTVQYVHVTLHKALKQAASDGLIPRNVAANVKSPRAQKKEIHPLNPEQARVLLESARGDRFEALYVLAVHSGLRQGELLALKWQDVDLEAGMLQVRRTLSITKDGPTFNPPKTAKGRRRVGLTTAAVVALNEHLRRQLAEVKALGDAYEDQGLVFPGLKGQPLRPWSLTGGPYLRLLERAGLPKETRFHDLRHTCATLLLCQGVHPKLVQELLGHATIAITLDTYSHVLPSLGDRAARAMESVFSGPTDL
jgi:integrase